MKIKNKIDLHLHIDGSVRPETVYELSRKYHVEPECNMTLEEIMHSMVIPEGEYDPERFYAMARGKETLPEGGERCFGCFALRLSEAAKVAAKGGFDYFTTTLTISPLKNAPKLNEIGEALAKQMGTHWLPSDFKKRNGYLRSTQLSQEYGLYRQNYCGCEFSQRVE